MQTYKVKYLIVLYKNGTDQDNEISLKSTIH
jgi:hypothetical protein